MINLWKSKIKNKVFFILSKRHWSKKIKRISKEQQIGNITYREKRQIKKYWKSYKGIHDYRWHATYDKVTSKNYHIEKFIPENFFYMIIEPHLNNYLLAKAYEDKNFHHHIFLKEHLPNVIIRNIHGRYYDENYKLITTPSIENIFGNINNSYIIKPSINTQGGKNVKKIQLKDGVIVLDGKKYRTIDSLSDLFGRDFLVQEIVQQHKMLSTVYPYSLNTVRIITFKVNNEIKCGSAVIRFGDEMRIVDNKGIACGITDEGKIKSYGTFLNLDKTSRHPLTKKEFKGIQIPNFYEMKALVRDLHLKLYNFDMISWDIAIDKNGNFKVIEYNLKGQEINFHQVNNGPLFGKYTSEILKEVFHYS